MDEYESHTHEELVVVLQDHHEPHEQTFQQYLNGPLRFGESLHERQVFHYHLGIDVEV
jgi:hypothetical protein